VRIPVLRSIFNRIAMPFNMQILRQDQSVVETQLPRRSDLRIGEKLVQADRPIVAYRSRRREMIEAATKPQVATDTV
jgi:hypothetical protein